MSNIVENPRGGCVLSGISATLAAIRGFCPVFHAGPGCCMQTSASTQTAVEISGVAIPCSNMLEKEVVFGGTDKLRTTVQGAIEVMDAEAYFILTGCTAGVIGDDVESVAEEFRQKGHAVYAIDTPGFVGDTNLGYEIVWNNLISQVVEERPRDEKLVNVFGIVPGLDPFWKGNLEEISRILKKLGLKVNTFYRDFQNLENVKNSSAAALNIVIHPWIFKGPAEAYQEKFGIPYIRIPGLPVGATDTGAFIRAVAEALQLPDTQVQAVIEEEERYLYDYLEHGIGVLGWKRLAVVGSASEAVGFTRYLANDYSLNPRVVVISEPIFRKEDKDRIIERLTTLEYADAPDVYFETDQFKIQEIVRQYDDIGLFLGSANDRESASYMNTWFSEVTFPITGKFIFNKTLAGYRGSLTLVEDLFSNL